MTLVNLKKNMNKGRNTFIVWSICYLWFIALYSIVWSMFLFFTIRETLWVTGTDLINLFVLLSGLFLVPANIQMLSRIANGHPLDSKTRILCCPMWLYLSFLVVINLTGAALCARKIRRCHWYMQQLLSTGMRLYKTSPVYKNFIDNMQWTLKCCGVKSYRDWFSMDWLDQIREYDWDVKTLRNKKADESINDSVPLSCCKGGSCYPHYLTELGVNTINKSGCAKVICRILIIVMTLHLIIFCSIALIESAILYCSLNGPAEQKTMKLICVNDKYRNSSNSRTRCTTDCTTTTEPTDFSDMSETDISVLEQSISQIKKSLDCVTKLCGKGNRASQTGSPQPRYTSLLPRCQSSNEYECTPNPCCTPDPCCTPIPCCTPDPCRSRVYDDSGESLHEYPTPPVENCQWDEGQSHSLVDNYEHSQESEPCPSPCRPSRWRLCEPCESPPRRSTESQSPYHPNARSPCRSDCQSPCWSVHSRRQLQKSIEVCSPRPSVVSVKLISKKSNGTQKK